MDKKIPYNNWFQRIRGNFNI